MTTGIMRSALATSLVCVLAAATAAAQQRGRNVPSERGQTPAALGVHGFSVVLVVGHSQGAVATETVPEAARKALADMKDFLPYKRYQLLDAAWILCCAPDSSQVSGRVRGPDSRDYLYTVDPGAIAGSKLNLRFTMREVRDVSASSVNVERLSDTARLEFLKQQSEAIRELEEAELQVRTIRPRVDVGTANPSELESATIRLRSARQRVQDLQSIGSGAQGRASASTNSTARTTSGVRGSTSSGRELMDSSFLISPGETVVIGTSRLNGDQALIALLTAATKPGSSR